MFYEEIFRKLNQDKVRYLVVGGVAVVLHGVVRLTVDLDIFAEFLQDNLIKFVTVLEELGYRPKVPVKGIDFADPSKREKWKKEKGMVVFSFFHPTKHEDRIDVFVYEPIQFESAYKERKIINARGIKIPVISIKHLKKMKKLANRPQDLADVRALEEIEKFKKK